MRKPGPLPDFTEVPEVYVPSYLRSFASTFTSGVEAAVLRDDRTGVVGWESLEAIRKTTLV